LHPPEFSGIISIGSLVWGDRMTSPTTLVEAPKGKGSPKLLLGVALILLALMAVVVFFSHRGLYQIYRLRQEQLRLDQRNAQLAEENARLTRAIDRLQHDPEMIQEFIRRELNFIKKNEIIFQLPPGSQSKTSAASSASRVALPEPPPANSEAAPKESGKAAWVWQFLEGAPNPRPSSPK
jgi:cell division protein FtsB